MESVIVQRGKEVCQNIEIQSKSGPVCVRGIFNEQVGNIIWNLVAGEDVKNINPNLDIDFVLESANEYIKSLPPCLIVLEKPWLRFFGYKAKELQVNND